MTAGREHVAAAGRRGVWIWGVPVLAWFVATFFLLGEVGLHRDDFEWHHRDPVTGEFAWTDLLSLHWPGYHRPLHLYFRGVRTLLWEWPWANQFVDAAIHGATAWLCWRLLAALVAPALAAGGALLFLVAPVGHEAILWQATTAAVIATALFLAASRAAIDHAQGLHGLRRVFLLCASIPFWYEQPATGLAWLPVLYLAAVPREVPTRAKCTGVVALMTAAWLPLAVVVSLILGLTPLGERGSATTLTAIASLPAKLGFLVDQGASMFLMRDLQPWALREGWARFTAVPGIAITLALLAAAAALPWGRAARDPGNWKTPPGVPRPGLTALFGAGVFATSFAPVVLIQSQELASRLMYFPIAGLTIAATVGADRLWARLRARPAAATLGPAIALCVLFVAVVAGSLSLVGVQSAMQKRSLANDRQLAELKELVPQPPTGTVFMPLRIEDGVPDLGPDLGYLVGVWEHPGAARNIVMGGFRSRDVTASAASRFKGFRPTAVDAKAVVFQPETWLGPGYVADEAGNCRVPWNLVVPFVVGPNGAIRLVERVVLEPEMGPDEDIALPLVARLREGPGKRWVPAVGMPVPGAGQPKEWRERAGSPLAWGEQLAWGVRRQAAVADLGGGSLSLSIPLEASPENRSLKFRLALPGIDIAPAPGPILVRWRVAGMSGELRFDPRSAAREQRWLPIHVSVPPLAASIEGELDIEATGLQRGFVTPAMVSAGRLEAAISTLDRLQRPPAASPPERPLSPLLPPPASPPAGRFFGFLALVVGAGAGLSEARERGWLRRGRELASRIDTATAAAGFGLALFVLLLLEYMGPLPSGTDPATSLLAGRSALEAGGRSVADFDLAPLLPLLLAYGERWLGATDVSRAVALLSALGVAFACHRVARGFLAPWAALGATVVVASSFPLHEAVASGAYHRCFAFAFGLLAAVALRSFATSPRAVRWVQGATLLTATALTDHASYTLAVTTTLVVASVRRGWRSERGPRRAGLVLLAVAPSLGIHAFVGSGTTFFPGHGSPAAWVAALAHAFRGPRGVWFAVVCVGLVALALHVARGRGGASAAGVLGFAGVAGIGFMATAEPWLLFPVLVAGAVGTFSAFADLARGRSWRAALAIATGLGVAISLLDAGAGEARAVFRWFRVLDEDLLATASWIEAQPQGRVVVNASARGEPVGDWFRVLLRRHPVNAVHSRLAMASPQADESGLAVKVFEPGLPWLEAATRATRSGTRFLVTRKADLKAWNTWAAAAGPALLFERGEFVVFSPEPPAGTSTQGSPHAESAVLASSTFP